MTTAGRSRNSILSGLSRVVFVVTSLPAQLFESDCIGNFSFSVVNGLGFDLRGFINADGGLRIP